MQLPEFPLDNKLWRIESIDNISQKNDDEVYVNIYLVRLKDDTEPNGAMHNSSLYRSDDNSFQSKVITIRLAFARHLTEGTVYKNGKKVTYFKNSSISFSFIPHKMSLIIPLSRHGEANFRNDSWEAILTNRQHMFTDDIIRKGKWITLLENISITSDSQPLEKIVISPWAIFKACFPISHKIISKLIYGHLEKLIDQQNSGFLEDEPGTYKAMLHAITRDIDGPIIANLLVDANAKKVYSQFRQNIIRMQNIIDSSQACVPLKISFPYSNLTYISGEGKYILFNKENESTRLGFYVTEITKIATKFPFTKFIPNRKNDAQKAKHASDELPEAYQKPQKKNENNHTANVIPTVGSNDDVSAYLQQLEDQTLQTNVFTPLSLEILNRDHKEFQHYVAAKIKPSQDIIDSNLIGAGESKFKNTGIRSDADENNAPPISLEDFIQIVSILNKHQFKARSLAIANFKKVGDFYLNHFDRKISGLISNHLTEDKNPRKYLVIEIVYYEKYSYLIEVEPKNQHHFSCGIIYSKQHEMISNNLIAFFMTKFIRNNGWSVFRNELAYKRTWNLELIKHRRNDNKATTKNIINKLSAIYS